MTEALIMGFGVRFVPNLGRKSGAQVQQACDSAPQMGSVAGLWAVRFCE